MLANSPTVTLATTSDSKTDGTVANISSDYSLSGSPVIASAGTAVTASVAGGPYTISADVSGTTSKFTVVTANSGTLTVTPAQLTASGTRSYDGTSTVAASVETLAGVVNSDSVSLSGTGSVTSKNVATNETVTGLTLSGAGAGNYHLSTAAATPPRYAIR